MKAKTPSPKNHSQPYITQKLARPEEPAPIRDGFAPTTPKTNEAKPGQREYAWQVATDLGTSFYYAWSGIHYAFISQRNFRIHTLITIVAIGLGLFLQVSALSMAVITLTCALVMVLELINTALESVVDLTVGQSYHKLAKIAKDCAAGAVLIAALAALAVAGFIFVPAILQKWG